MSTPQRILSWFWLAACLTTAFAQDDATKGTASSELKIWWNAKLGQELGLSQPVRNQMDEILINCLNRRAGINQELQVINQRFHKALISANVENTNSEIEKRSVQIAKMQQLLDQLKLEILLLMTPQQRTQFAEKAPHLLYRHWVRNSMLRPKARSGP